MYLYQSHSQFTSLITLEWSVEKTSAADELRKYLNNAPKTGRAASEYNNNKKSNYTEKSGEIT